MRIRRELKAAAKDNLFANFKNIFTFTLAMLGVMIASSIFWWLAPFLAPAFSLSITIFFLAIARGKKTKLEMVFAGFRDYWRALLATLAMSVGIALGLLCFAIPGIILSFAWSQTLFILADDKNISVFGAMRKSYQLMKGHKFDYWVLGLSFIGWSLLVVMTLGLGVILFLPYIQLTFSEFYLDLCAHDKEMSGKSQTTSKTIKKTSAKSKASKKK